ncbi:M1 family metallopeptidase [Candidatus Saccharibacteria bacterium]|nr:M1 family metallopeptidase [Candidatus Saccharibacteria bacterium]
MIERFLNYFEPKTYKLGLDLRTEHRTIIGRAKITGDIKAETIKFHAEGMKIINVFINSHRMHFEYDNHVITIANLSTVPGAEVQIDFEAKIQDRMHGCYVTQPKPFAVGDDRPNPPVVATQFESHYARLAFPCIDEPAAKAQFSLNLTHEPGLHAISNTPSYKEAAQDNGRVRNVFRTTPRMSTYLLAWVVGNMQKVTAISQTGIHVTTYATKHHPLAALEFANQTAQDAIDFFTEKFSTRYPLPKLDQVALPDFEAGAMENWGLITYRESALLCEPTAALATKKYIAAIIVHEVAHQWFGNLVTMNWWDDLWLNESFATLMEAVCLDQLYPEWKVWQDFWTDKRSYAMNRDLLPGVQAVRQPIDDPAEIQTLFDGAIVYSKGACLINMLRLSIGDDRFFAGIHKYFQANAYKATTAADLWPHFGPEVEPFMTPWLDTPGFPVVEVARNEQGSLHAGKQRRLVLDERNRGSEYPLPPLRSDCSGYYALKPDVDAEIAAWQSRLLPNKVQLLLDWPLLVRDGEIPATALLSLLNCLAGETDRILWEAALDSISVLKPFFDHDSEPEKLFHNMISRLTKPLFDQLGWILRDGDTPDQIDLRARIISLLVMAGEPSIVSSAVQIFDNVPVDQIDPNVRPQILTAKCRYLYAPETVSRLSDFYQQVTDPELKDDLMIGLTATSEPKHLAEFLERTKDPSFIRQQDALSWFAGVLKNPLGTKLAFDWCKANWKYLDEQFGPSQSLDYYPRLLGRTLKTDAEAKDFTRFFDDFEKRTDLRRAIELAHVEIEARADLIDKNKSAVHAALKSQSS